ncbi:Predicted nucleotidyltransferase [Anaerovirgula multivorans]|uniref:tRNA(Met) cytidine acetate ligase n=1 Tax=Anaerovirgula multivorans TaxID=312168 RepID=A0A239A6K3_9FIRM|nr:nucleotidyltransferase [Anaerovirgula multivorans]SNR90523.1 Predicted nucleotidyltransferase [Anaerovirgula multivorans]
MKVLGLITEYNPFHNGHLYHLNKSIEITGATHTVAVMSGNFLQRGEPALVHKWQRAKMAIECGVDLVIELPTAYACATAELFAFGSINLLHNLGVIDCIAFGSEYGKISTLEMIADILFKSPLSFENSLKSYLKEGLPFPAARSKALIDFYKFCHSNGCDEESMNIESIMNNPNNILSIEYLKALKRLGSTILPYTIPRVKAAYHSKNMTSDISSATAIREHLKMRKPLEDLRKVMPSVSHKLLKEAYEAGIAPVFKEDFEHTILTILRRENSVGLAEYFDVNEGLENRIYECSHHCSSIESLYNCIKSKRYTLTRIQRICMHALLNLKKKDLLRFNHEGGPQYIRALGFNNKGREILKSCKSKSKLPIINKINQYIPSDETAKELLELDIRATNIYTLALKNHFFSSKPLDYYQSPYYARK